MGAVARAALLFSAALFCSLLAHSGVHAKDPVHILYLTDCTMYSDWQTVGMAFSFKNSGQTGHITRVMCCTDEEKAKYNHDMLDLMPSHVAPSFAYNERTKDSYPAFNKPGAVLDFMTKGTPLADYMLVIDSDMILRHPFRPDIYNMTPGKAISADYTYMIGCNNDLAKRHIPEIPDRNDTLAGPLMRHCDMVGGYTFMGREDLAKVAPLWLSITEDVRQDPEAWRLSGDQYVEKGGKPWISEMYGYSFACAKSNVWHTWDTQVMHYPTYSPAGVPKLMHYGLLFTVDDYEFDKHWHYQFDVAQCPPWDLEGVKNRKGGLFAHPPRPSTLKQKDVLILYYRDLLSVETAATINAGLCHYHLQHCPPSKQLLDECTHALDLYKETMVELRKVEAEVARNKGLHAVLLDLAVQPPVGPATLELEKGLKEMAANLAAQNGGGAQGVTGQAPVVAVKQEEVPKHRKDVERTMPQEDKKLVSPAANPDNAKKDQEAKHQADLEAKRQAIMDSIRKQREKEDLQFHAEMKSGVIPRKRRLAVSCSRMAMSMQEVEDCLAAAKEGNEYQQHKRVLTADADAKAPDVGHPTAHSVDPSQLRVEHYAQPAAHQMGTWEVMGIWLLCVLVMMVFVPRWYLRMRRRVKPTKHSE